jgi:hypothetical protein
LKRQFSYLTAKPSRDLITAAHQQTTFEWWETVRPKVECYVSPFVIDEASRGDNDYARKRLEAIADFSVLDGGVKMHNDPIIDDVRQSRLEIEKECQGDFAQIYARTLEVQKNVAGKVVSRPDPTKMTIPEIDEERSAYRREKRL